MRRILITLIGATLLISVAAKADELTKKEIEAVETKIRAVNWEYNYNKLRQRELIKLSTDLQRELKRLKASDEKQNKKEVKDDGGAD